MQYHWSRYATLMLKAEIYMWAAKVSITGFTATGATDLTDCQRPPYPES